MVASKTATTKKPAAKSSKTAAKTTTAKKTASTKTATKTPAVKKPAAPKTTATKKPAAAKPASKAAPKTTVEKKFAPAKSPVTKLTTSAIAAPSPEQRYKMIEEAAYFIAEKNGFAAGSLDYWVTAEAQIDAMLSDKKK